MLGESYASSIGEITRVALCAAQAAVVGLEGEALEAAETWLDRVQRFHAAHAVVNGYVAGDTGRVTERLREQAVAFVARTTDHDYESGQVPFSMMEVNGGIYVLVLSVAAGAELEEFYHRHILEWTPDDVETIEVQRDLRVDADLPSIAPLDRTVCVIDDADGGLLFYATWKPVISDN